MSNYLLMSELARMRYGERIIRSMFAEFVDVERIAATTDAELARLPGVGPSNVRQIRELLNKHAGGKK